MLPRNGSPSRRPCEHIRFTHLVPRSCGEFSTSTCYVREGDVFDICLLPAPHMAHSHWQLAGLCLPHFLYPYLFHQHKPFSLSPIFHLPPPQKPSLWLNLCPLLHLLCYFFLPSQLIFNFSPLLHVPCSFFPLLHFLCNFIQPLHLLCNFFPSSTLSVTSSTSSNLYLASSLCSTFPLTSFLPPPPL